MSLVVRVLDTRDGGFPSLRASVRRSNSRHPNIVLIYADDLGFGDVSPATAQPPVQTPNIVSPHRERRDQLHRRLLHLCDLHAVALLDAHRQVCLPAPTRHRRPSRGMPRWSSTRNKRRFQTR